MENKYFEELVQGLPIEFGSLFTYPIRVRDYEKFCKCASCLKIMQQAMPAELAGVSYLKMLYLISSKENPTLANLSQLLSMTLHVKEENIRLLITEDKIQIKIIKPLRIKGWLKKHGLKKIKEFKVIETISELKFMALRKQIALQNNIKLPREEANLEILESEKDLQEMNSIGLDIDFEAMLFSVTHADSLQMEQLMNMTLYELDGRVNAITRSINYQIYSVAENSGMVKFKNGNPYPSWCYDRMKDNLHGMIPMSQLNKQIGGVVEDRTAK
ncbi:MAG: hypothetical protein AB9836_04480 [Aminipila sp.]